MGVYDSGNVMCFNVFQCHGSSGHCWCVDINGRERAGTRTAPGSPPVDCKKPGDNMFTV